MYSYNELLTLTEGILSRRHGYSEKGTGLFLLDMATTTVAAGKIGVYDRRYARIGARDHRYRGRKQKSACHIGRNNDWKK
jgi:hypothetical protein